MDKEWTVNAILDDWKAQHGYTDPDDDCLAFPEEMLGSWLAQQGCVGLADGEGCFCPTEDALACGDWSAECRAVYSVPCERMDRCGDCEGPSSYGCLVFVKPSTEA